MRQKSVEWYTPAWIFEQLGIEFDLDPASPCDVITTVPASTKFTRAEDGLTQDWFGRVWLNPPYGRETSVWMNKFISHRNGIALVFCRTDTKWFQSALRHSDAALFFSGRIQFIPGYENSHKKSRCGAASAFFAFGIECVSALHNLQDKGYLICR